MIISAEEISNEHIQCIQSTCDGKGNTPSFADLSYYPHFHNFSNQFKGVILNTTFEIWNSGCCGLTYSILEECSWVNVTPSYGHSYGEKDEIRVVINTTDLSFGFHQCGVLLDTSDIDAFFIVTINIVDFPNNPPETPKLVGPTSGKYDEKQTFTARALDSDGDQLWYKWDFGDGNVTDWIGPFENNTYCNKDHIWKEEGRYNVKVRAKDNDDALSEWSEPLSIELPKNKFLFPHLNQFIQWIKNIIF